MCDVCDGKVSRGDFIARVHRRFENGGIGIVHDEGDDRTPSLSYTYGLTNHDMPELCVSGLTEEASSFAIRAVIKSLAADDGVGEGTVYPGSSVSLRNVADPEQLWLAHLVNDGDFIALQIVLPHELVEQESL